MTNNYQDKVNETFDKYAFQIQEAINQLRRENPNFGVYQFGNQKVELSYEQGKGITGISYMDTKLLEKKLQELTKDSNARLVRSTKEALDLVNRVARFSSSDDVARLDVMGDSFDKSEWLSEGFKGLGMRSVRKE